MNTATFCLLIAILAFGSGFGSCIFLCDYLDKKLNAQRMEEVRIMAEENAAKSQQRLQDFRSTRN